MKLMGELLSLLSNMMAVKENNSKTYKNTVKISIMRSIIQTFAYLLLGGINGMIISMMAIVRQVFLYYKKFTGKIVGVWILASAVINIYFASAFTDLFPFAATVQFTLMAKGQTTKSLKYATIINTLIWSVYHIAHNTWINLCFDVILVTVGIIRLGLGVED